MASKALDSHHAFLTSDAPDVQEGGFEIQKELYRTFGLNLEDEINRQLEAANIPHSQKGDLYSKWLLLRSVNAVQLNEMKLRGIMEAVRHCLEKIINAYEKAAEDDSTPEDYQAYLNSLKSIDLDPAKLYKEVSEISKNCPALKNLAEETRAQIEGLKTWV